MFFALPMLVVASDSLGQISLNGRMERIGPFRVVRVWGEPNEMGFAHGYLLAKDIIEHILGKEIYEDSDVAVDMRELARHQAGKGSNPAPANGTSSMTVGARRRERTQAEEKAAG